MKKEENTAVMTAQDLVVEQLRRLGGLAIAGFGSEEIAAEKLTQLNDIIAADPKVLRSITDPENIETFNELKRIIQKEGHFLLKVPELMDVAKKFKI